MKQKFSSALSLALIVAMLFTSVALADNLVGDGDGLVPISDNPIVNIGSICLGQSKSGSIVLAISRQGSATGTNTFANGADITVSAGSPSGDASVSTSFSDTAIDLPTNWTSFGNGTLSGDIAKSFITANTAGSSLGNKTATIGYSASGLNTNGNNISRPLTVTVNWNVTDCTPADTTAPTAAPTLSGTAGTNGWYTSDVTVTWNWSDTGGSGINTNSCPATSTSSGEGALTVSAECYDLAGNKGSASVNVNVDKTAPAISFVGPSTSAWYNADVTANWSCSDATSGPVSVSVSAAASGEGNAVAATGTCVDLAGLSTSDTQYFMIDKTAPVAIANAAPPANSYGWNNTSVTVSYSGDDGSGSGIDFCDADDVLSSEGAGQTASGTCTDNAGNVSAPATATINIDLTNPLVSLVGGPADGGTYYFGFVPAAPTCDASDALSGLDGACSVIGYSTAIGGHTVTANATDKAGNSASDSAAYTVNAWTLNGFYQPVDMGNVFNTVKGGSTVPLKFEVFAGPTELTSTSAIKSFVAKLVSCSTSAPSDEIELVTTGGTSLRYDATGGQFIQNWQTPKQAGLCYMVTMTTLDNSTISAYFKTK